MIRTREVVIEEVRSTVGSGEDLSTLARACVAELSSPREIGGVIAATFSHERRFPALSVEVAHVLGLPTATPAFDLQMACSAYPYAVYLAGKLAEDVGNPVLIVNGDVQRRLVDATDHDTGSIFSDAVTASVVRANACSESPWAFLSQYGEDLTCGESGPIHMAGMNVFNFVALEVSRFLKSFLSESGEGEELAGFVPHQAQPYMIRQLAKSLKLESKLRVLPAERRNPGSCSIPMTLAQGETHGRILIAGFGAGYSAATGVVRVV